MSDRLEKLLNDYRETRRCLEMGIEWLPNNEFAKAKLEVVNMIIADLENIEA
ncbi:hypothetical protein [uncultured Clostridium sp.]|uniref:hypothetical protein n=1 Tax=uncultured Clostridium sp. TaxID=59620 RepID=UPI00263076C7|nr:hypothetical protein [uncultured Clostridium sp.]